MQKSDHNAALRNLSALVDFSNLVNSNLDLNFSLNNLLLTCFGKFHTTRGIVALKNDEDKLVLSASKGIKPDVISSFPSVPIDNFETNNQLNECLEENKLCVSQTIDSSGKSIGVIFLGERISKQKYDEDDKNFLRTLTNIAASAIDNSLIVEKLKNVNRDLDSKVNQLSSLFDLSKEFSGILEKERVGKLLVFSIIGQLMVTKFAVAICNDDDYEILESRIKHDTLLQALKSCSSKNFQSVVFKDDLQKEYDGLKKIGIELIVPMRLKDVTKGLILLGSRTTKVPYSKSDIEYVSSVGSLAIISIENARLLQEELEKQRMEKDLEIAQKIQRNLLPDTIPEMENFEIAAINQSARQVGGDYYDIIKLDDDRALFAVADVSGKGVQAALLMSNMQAFLQSISKQNIELDEASNLINDLVSENTTDGSFITFFWGIINDKTKELNYVNMGHNPPLLVQNNELRKLKLGGMILGVMPTMVPYKSEKILLESNDRLYLFTDGITEAMNFEGEEYSDEKLEELILTLDNLNAEESLNKILTSVKEHTKGAPQSDDITAMVIKVK